MIKYCELCDIATVTESPSDEADKKKMKNGFVFFCLFNSFTLAKNREKTEMKRRLQEQEPLLGKL